MAVASAECFRCLNSSPSYHLPTTKGFVEQRNHIILNIFFRPFILCLVIHLPRSYTQIHWLLISHIARRWTIDTKNPAISNGSWTSLDSLGLCLGGGGGSRTRVRKYSTAVSTHVGFALLLLLRTPKARIDQLLSRLFSPRPLREERERAILPE